MRGAAKGFRVTLRRFFAPKETQRYPEEKPALPERSRGPFELTFDPVSGKPLCTSCGWCTRICPVEAIKVDYVEAISGVMYSAADEPTLAVSEAEAEAEAIDEAALQSILDGYDESRGGLIVTLQEIQERFGYLPRRAMRLASERTGLPLPKIYGLVTFFHQFLLEPPAKTTVFVCRGTSCRVRGGKSVLRRVQRELGDIGVDEKTADNEFYLRTFPCVGECSHSPIIGIRDEYHGRLSRGGIRRLLKEKA